MSRARTAAVLVLGAMLLAGPVGAQAGHWQPVPPRQGWMVPEAPPVSAASFILFDETADWVIASGNPDARRPPASTTKMMTALVALEHASLDDIVTVTAEAAEAGEAEIGLVADERIPMGDLITAMLVRSANDAAEAVAIHVGGSIAGFADLMNQKAAAMGLENSHFMNPHGLDEPDHYTSAADLLAISRAVLADPQLAAIVRSVRMEFRPAPDGTERGGPATNSLLESYPGAIGIKTGYTSQASLVLAAAAERDQRQLVAVVMGSEGPEAHFADASELLDYGFDNARILPVLAGGQFAAGDISANPIAATARLEALAWLSASGLLTVPPAPNAEPVRVLREPAAVPDWKDAFSWLGRYWAWVAGDG